MATVDVPELVHDAELWSAVHRDVQQRLSLVDERLGDLGSQWVVSEGRTAGREFPLFSYRSYRLVEQAEFDPIVVGVLFRCRDGQFSAHGDISREEGGEMLAELSSRAIPADKNEIVVAARKVAEELSELAKSVDEALGNWRKG